MTDTLKRYSHWCNYDDGSGPAEADGDQDGDWVKYSDAIAVRDAAVAAEREKWQPDAERYRWLRDDPAGVHWWDSSVLEHPGAIEFDAAVDAAMAGARATAQT